MFFNLKKSEFFETLGKKVSVPLRGFCFSTPYHLSVIGYDGWEFPSPYGDFVFQPLPFAAALDELLKECFRPLTGILFFNDANIVESREIGGRFRPLTGILFFNNIIRKRDKEHTELFPSPYGDFVFQQAEWRRHRSEASLVSVPLRGFCFSTFGNFFAVDGTPTSFRPLTGILFFNFIPALDEVLKTVCSFRPLTGILFFNSCVNFTTIKGLRRVSVPLRGFCFSTKHERQRHVFCCFSVSVPLRGFCFSTV